MFGIDGIEFFIILIIMIVVIGPKELPKMMRAFGQATMRMRKTAMEFRRHFDEAMREAELDGLSDTIKEVQKLDPRKDLTRIFDPVRNITNDIKTSLASSETASLAPSSSFTAEIEASSETLLHQNLREGKAAKSTTSQRKSGKSRTLDKRKTASGDGKIA